MRRAYRLHPIAWSYHQFHWRETDGVSYICGMMSHMCVDATVRAAFDLGFTCILTHDACATRELTFNGTTVPAAQVQASYMAALGAVYAQVKGVDEILENMATTI